MTTETLVEKRPARVPVSEIVRQPDLQVRKKLDRATCNSYAQQLRNGGRMPPVVLADVGGALLLVDGWHRLAAMERCGLTEIDAEIVTCPDLREAGWLAAEANLRHGLPLKPSEMRPVFRAYIKAQKHVLQRGRHGRIRKMQSYRDIASALGGRVSFGAVRNWMRQDFPATFAAMGAGDSSGAPGGLRGEGPEAALAREVSRSLDQAVSASRGISDPNKRGALVARAEGALEDIRRGGPFKVRPPLPPVEDSDF